MQPLASAASALPEGARCAHHPDTGAIATCTRCGDYLCRDCVLVQAAPNAYCENCAVSHFEATRREHIQHEASIRSIGTLYYLGAASYLLIGIAGAFIEATDESPEPVFVALFLALAVVLGVLGRGLRRLKRGARIGAGILSAFGLLGVPIGTLINGYFLYLLFSEKGNTIFSPEYQAVIDATPHVKYRPSALASALVLLLVLLLFGGLVALVVELTP